MRWLGFAERMAELSQGPQWDEMAAGAMVYRLANDALRFGFADDRATQFAQAQVERVDRVVVRERLTILMSFLTPEAQARDDWPDSLIARLMAYGHQLHDDGHFSPAVDVFTLIYDRAVKDVDIRLKAMLRCGFALRQLARFQDAKRVYEMLRAQAVESGDDRMMLEADLGLARCVVGRGDLQTGDRLTREVVQRATALNQTAVAANGMIDLAWIAGASCRPHDVVSYSLSAYADLETDEHRERVLMNTATALRELRRPNSAQTVASFVVRRGRSNEVRISALTLLYNLAIDARNIHEAAFYRRHLANLSMHPIATAEYYHAIACEMATFGRFEEASLAAQKMLAVCEEHRLNEHSFRAEQAIRDIDRGAVPAMYEFRATPELSGVEAHRMDEMEVTLATLCGVSP
jgi:hypothetical protein